ncbi:MAG: hypothetical protein ACRD2R_03925, partial [Terriglobales bacterium]
ARVEAGAGVEAGGGVEDVQEDLFVGPTRQAKGGARRRGGQRAPESRACQRWTGLGAVLWRGVAGASWCALAQRRTLARAVLQSRRRGRSLAIAL